MADFNIDNGMAVASVAGATAATLASTSKDHWSRKAMEGVCGALVGVFCGPGIGDAAGIVNEHTRTAIAFGSGAAGLLMMGLFLNAVKSEKIRSAIDAFVGRMTNTK